MTSIQEFKELLAAREDGAPTKKMVRAPSKQMGSGAQLHASRARAYLAAGDKTKARAHFRRAYQLFGGPRRIQSATDGTDAYEAAAAVEAAVAVEAVVLAPTSSCTRARA